MSGALLGALAVALVGGTAAAAASALRLPDLPRFVLGAYVLGFAEVIAVTLVLSAFGSATRAALLVAVAALFAASVAGWALLGAPGLPPVDLGRISALRRAPSLVVLSLATVLALLYVLALIAGTPPASHDALTYHLTRAALWSQGDGVGYIAHAYDGRLNAHPANAEIALTFLLETGRNERLAGLVQFGSVLMISVGVYALARNLRLAPHEAAFGALLTLTLPVIILQASTAQNDLVAASFLLAAAVFLLGRSRRELFLAALATALAIGTKMPAAYGLVVLLAIALVATPATRRRQRIAAIAGGSAVGSYWFVQDLVRTGSPLGDLSDRTDLIAFLQPKENFYGAFARFLDAIDLSGAVGANVGLFVVVAVAVTLVLSIRGRKQWRRAIPSALLTGALVVTPLVLLAVGNALWDIFLDRGGPGVLDDEFLYQRSSIRTVPSENNSWFGPLGLPLAVGVAAAAAVLVRRGGLPQLALVLGAAPLAWFVLVSLSLAYDTTQGRFFVFPVALSASLWGLALRVSPLGAAVTAVAVTTAFLSLANYLEKPSGLRLLDSDVPAPVWSAERWEIQSGPDPTTTRGQRLLAGLPGGSSIALALGFNDVGYPAFGPTLEHRVELVPAGSSASRSSADWLVANSSRAADIDRTCWLPASRQPGGWTVFRRASSGCSR